ncbi:MAG: hypothetical protein Q4Q23_07300 [Methanobacteriaceae archaeon]|nr:hypothetical protein [Methanobacteriaceae archaeon]
MNKKGQLFIIEALLAITLLLIIIVSVSIILDQENQIIPTNQYKKSQDTLNIIFNTKGDKHQLFIDDITSELKINNDLNIKTKEKLMNITQKTISNNYYTLEEINKLNKTIINSTPETYNQIDVSTRTRDDYIFRLKIYK